MPATHPGMYRHRRTLFPEESTLLDGNKKVAAVKQKHKGAQKSEVKDSTINDDAAIEHNNNFAFSPIKRTKKGHNVASKSNSKMDKKDY